MHPSAFPPPRLRARLAPPGRGFTLIELMIAAAVLVIVVGIAYPSFMDQLRQTRRTDAFDAISRIQQLQAQHRANNPSYAASLTALGVTTTTSPNGLYTISTAAGSGAAAATTFTVTATAVSGRSQASDSGCTTLTLTISAANTTYGPNNRCWRRS